MTLHPTEVKGSNTIACVGIALALLVIVGSILGIHLLRKDAIQTREEQLSNLTFILAEHADQTLYSASTALNSLVDAIRFSKVENENQYVQFAGTEDRFKLLQDKTKSNPIIDVATYIAEDGKVLNFSRSYPPPEINLATRDYFQYLSQNNTSETFYSIPVQNKGNNKWVFYLAKRINGVNGTFLGVAIVGISSEVFSRFYERIGDKLGTGSAFVLLNNEQIIMTRWPFNDELISKRFNSNVVQDLFKVQMSGDESLITFTPSSTRPRRAQQITASRKVQAYPFVVSVVDSEQLFLISWRHIATAISGITIALLVFIALGTLRFNQSFRQKMKHEHFANYDLLTKLPNRLLFTDRLHQAIKLAERNKTKFALLFVDLDHLKLINDQFNHEAGDALLVDVAKRMVNCIRNTDAVSRFGGDEFIILLSNIESEGKAISIAEKVCEAVQEPFTFRNRTFNCGASIGVAIYPDQAIDASTLIKRADEAMYIAKSNGRNQVHLSQNFI